MKNLPSLGFVLIPVVLALVVVATVALLLNLEGPMSVERVAAEAEATQVEYLTQAGMAHAEWQLRGNACSGDFAIPTTALDTGTYTATATGMGTTTTYNLTVDQDTWIRSDNVTSNNGAGNDQHITFAGGNIKQALMLAEGNVETGDPGYLSVWDMTDPLNLVLVKQLSAGSGLPAAFTSDAHDMFATPDGTFVFLQAFNADCLVKVHTVTDNVVRTYDSSDGLSVPHGIFIN